MYKNWAFFKQISENNQYDSKKLKITNNIFFYFDFVTFLYNIHIVTALNCITSLIHFACVFVFYFYDVEKIMYATHF